MKATVVSLTNFATATSTTSSKPATATATSQSAMVSGSTMSVQSTVLQSQTSTVLKQKPADAAGSALNKTFEKETTCNSLVLLKS